MRVQVLSEGSPDAAVVSPPIVPVPLPATRNIRRSLVNEVLDARLARISAETAADFVILIQAHPTAPGAGMVLASAGADSIGQFFPNEPIHFDPDLPSTPATLDSFDCWSATRPCRLSFGYATIVPWGSRTTSGWLVLASSGSAAGAHLTHRAVRHYRAQLRRIYADAGLRATNKLRLDIARATRAIIESDLDHRGLDEHLTNVLLVARGVLKTAGCYLSMPEENADHFRFIGHVGVRTRGFKQLRVGAGQGLGGRVRDMNRTLRTLNYSRDFRDNDDPVQVTVREGFHSAMCAPLTSGDQIFGLLYAANRHFTPFTESDGEVLTELAGNISALLRRGQWDDIKLAAARRRERDQMARDLHDSVVRNLMEIGYASRVGRDLSDPTGARKHFDAIELAAESCLQAIRGQIAALTSDWDGRTPPTIDSVINLLRTTPGTRRLNYVFQIGIGTARQTLPPQVATALVRIGREALRNAELHSRGSQAIVEIGIESRVVRLAVEDDGEGIDANLLPALIGSSEHLGLRQMRSIAEENDGRCILTTGRGAGLRVEVMVPLT
jgi:signal transduction histidine kinase